MPSGIDIDWSQFDDLIKIELPKYTIVDFTKKYLPNISPGTVGNRAKQLCVQPKIRTLTDIQKTKISNQLKKQFDVDVINYVKNNLNKMARVDIAKSQGISIYLVNRIARENGLIPDNEFSKKISAERSKQHINLASKGFWDKWRSDVNFREKMSSASSIRNKELWKDEIYRLKVSGGIKKAYEETDFRQRLSMIGKNRYQNDPSVRVILQSDRPFKNSKLNDLIATKLELFGIEFSREFEIANYKFDFKIGNILLEVNGNYWHSLPENIRNDRAKISIINNYYAEYKIKTIWESEIKSIRCNDRLLELLEIKPIVPVEIKLSDLKFIDNPDNIDKFLSSFHYLGSTRRKQYTFGLKLYNNLIAVATFGQPIRPNVATGRVLELTRLCRHPRFYNRNMLSQFLSKCVKYISKLDKYDNIVAFTDLRLHTGGIYRAAGWKDLGETAPDYNYMSVENIPMHKKTLYNRARKDGLTEREYAELHGYKKTNIGTKRKFIKQIV